MLKLSSLDTLFIHPDAKLENLIFDILQHFLHRDRNSDVEQSYYPLFVNFYRQVRNILIHDSDSRWFLCIYEQSPLEFKMR